MFELSSQAIAYICDECTAALRPYITSGATADPPPSEVREAVCASPECGAHFQSFVSTLHAGSAEEVSHLCALDELGGNQAMGVLLGRLAAAIEGYMGLTKHAQRDAASALLRAELGARAPVIGRIRWGLGAAGAAVCAAAALFVGTMSLMVARIAGGTQARQHTLGLV